MQELKTSVNENDIVRDKLVTVIDIMCSGKIQEAKVMIEQLLIINYKFNYAHFVVWRDKQQLTNR